MMSDLIRREDAIKAIEELPNAYNGWSDAYDKAYIIGTLEEVPSADRPQGWIPCSERLPTKAGHYLCSFNKPNRIDNIYVDLAYWTGSRWYGYLANEIIAWMPLPEPWKGADDETD